MYFQAAARNIRLVVMPQGMSKRTLNTTQYRPKTDLILWRVHVVFIINNNFTSAMLLKPENQNGQNANFGEYSSSSSSMSITGENYSCWFCSLILLDVVIILFVSCCDM